MDNIVIPPVYDGKESVNSYQRKVSNFLIEMKKKNYNIVTNFFNKLLNSKNVPIEKDNKYYKHSLSQFKNITHDDLIKKISENKQVFTEYADFFKNEYNIEYNLSKINDSVYAVFIIRKILKTQDCLLKSNEKIVDDKNVLCYSIK